MTTTLDFERSGSLARLSKLSFSRVALFAPWAGWTGKVALGGLLSLLGYLVLYIVRPEDGGLTAFLSDFGMVPLEAAGIILALAVVVREQRTQARLAWLLIAFALAFDLGGNLLYGFYELAGEQPFPSFADGLYLAFYPLTFIGLLWLPTASIRRELFNWRTWSNVLIVLLGGSVTLIHFVLMPVLADLTSDFLSSAISLAYPLGDLALLAALATIGARQPFAGDRRPLAFFMIAVSAWFLADLTFAINTVNGTYAAGDISDVIWLIGDGAFLLAAHSQLVNLSHPAAENRQIGSPLSLGRVGPYLMLGLGLGTLIVASLTPGDELVLLVGMVAGLTVIVMIRQSLDDRQRRGAEAALAAGKLAAAEESYRQSRSDALTNMPNRTSVHEVLLAQLAAARVSHQPLTLVFIGLNLFKAVNSNLGHEAGDYLLIEVGQRLSNCLRAGDTAARLGGDEFALILPGTSLARGLEVAERARAEIERSFMIEGHEVDISAAFGLAAYPEGGAQDDDDLMHQADTAMYRAKRQHLGPTPYDVVFEGTVAGLSDLAELRRGIAGDGLVLFFQPIWERLSGRTVGAEALVRWQHPTRGLLTPSDFIPLATQTGLIRALDRRVLDMACAQTWTWLGGGLNLRISVNVSRDSLQDPAFATCVRTALARYRLSPSDLELEITEEGLLDNPLQASLFVKQMRELGVRVSIDDFGTGYSSLARLRHLPVQALKIDQSFVRGAIGESADATIVESVIALGHRLGLEVVAEGVEDAETMAYLEDCGIDMVQGYFLGRPMLAEDLTLHVWAERRSGPSAKRH